MDINHLNFILDLSTILIIGLIWIGIITFLRLKKKKSLIYLIFFTIFFAYVATVLYYTEFKFQYLLLLRYFTPNLRLNGIAAGKSLNLIPLITLTLKDLRTSSLNILLMIPFGFGLPFITNLRMKRVVVIGALFSIGIESLQLVTGLLAKITFRIADINDVIFNTIGVAIGYMLFIGFMGIYRHLSRNWKTPVNPILQYIADRPQIDKQSGIKSIPIILTATIVILLTATVCYGHAVYQKSHPQASIGVGAYNGQSDSSNNGSGGISQSGDLCGGTGGTGQILSVGNSAITIKRKDGVVQTINLTAKTEIRNSEGSISASDLKIGDRVTIVIPGANGTASTVLVCGGTGTETHTGQ
jgi:glycopeptide antibiotics resistance protein